MGKRSNFERVERDFYPTPCEAVRPLLPFFADSPSLYIEPCAGDGRLIDHLARLAPQLQCAGAYDIAPRRWDIQPADALSKDWPDGMTYITNPPWRRDILHPMIEALSAGTRTAWLLFDADWMHTRQAARFMPRLRAIASIGRVKWIEGSASTGKDNCCWYQFAEHGPASGPIFHGRTEG